MFCHQVCMYTICVPGAYRRQKKALNPLKLMLQMVMSHMGAVNWAGSSAGAAGVLSCWAISLAPKTFCLNLRGSFIHSTRVLVEQLLQAQCKCHDDTDKQDVYSLPSLRSLPIVFEFIFSVLMAMDIATCWGLFSQWAKKYIWGVRAGLDVVCSCVYLQG